ncbi:MAG: phytanoyl-CoA dioxygenase, partial [Cytophagales bacterium]|nr:phytanoyl-CoA dioxygenase [Armatimonadota bacterium]
MSNTITLPPLTARGNALDLSPDAFGFLTDSSAIAHDGDALRA